MEKKKNFTPWIKKPTSLNIGLYKWQREVLSYSDAKTLVHRIMYSYRKAIDGLLEYFWEVRDERNKFGDDGRLACDKYIKETKEDLLPHETNGFKTGEEFDMLSKLEYKISFMGVPNGPNSVIDRFIKGQPISNYSKHAMNALYL